MQEILPMRRLFWTVFLLPLAVPAYADEPKPNALTPKEATDGWLLLFDGETTFGLKVGGDATVTGGELVLGGGKATTWTIPFAQFDLRLEFSNREGIGATNFVLDWGTKQRGTSSTTIITGFGKEPAWSTLHLTVEQDPAIVSGERTTAKSEFTSGKPGYYENATKYGQQVPAAIRFELPAGNKLAVRSVKLRPLGLKSIFNGKDLTGWKKYDGDKARAKSEFTVTPEGWINLKNGPGDLQSEGQWADFVLQLECISNGKHLNSGVFFRCIPGQYQNGYEAQIHNGFNDDAAKEYTVEEYDPETHELKEKRKVKSPALDYGTGAIYRRVPARSQVSKDGEWFTMTVVAQGRHIATWVNGVQQTDWTDNRPLKENPREGCRLEKGPISLQGHDPTTDLSFRNLRLAELPAAQK
jgi:Domain of Unknown Function (DUF1080)